MTRARTASNGVVTPPPLDRWIDAVLMLCVSLVQGAATTLQMWRRARQRDWHTQSGASALPQAKSGISSQGTNPTHGVILGLVPRISVGTPRGLSIDPHEAINQDARHKAERDSGDSAPTKAISRHSGRTRSVRAGTQGRRAHPSYPASGFSLALFILSLSKGASGMTPSMCCNFARA